MRHWFSGKSADNVWHKAICELLSDNSSVQQSRLGEMFELQHVSFNIEDPRQRWVVNRRPSINPAFAIAEVFSLLGGANDANFLNYWNPSLPKYAGSANEYYGAYGFRLRKHFGFDQVDRAYQALSCNPKSRQVILQIWDPVADLPTDNGFPRSEDIPCNICSLLKVRDGKLDWLQVMRSNDAYRGTPYNFVQFTTLQEIFAGWLSLDVGTYCHVSDSLHLYKKDLSELSCDSVENDFSLLNEDDLRLSKPKWDHVFDESYAIMKKMTEDDLSIEEFRENCKRKDLPQAYQNLVLVAAADCARRRNWKDEMHEAIGICSNILLVALWDNWRKRKMS